MHTSELQSREDLVCLLLLVKKLLVDDKAVQYTTTTTLGSSVSRMAGGCCPSRISLMPHPCRGVSAPVSFACASAKSFAWLAWRNWTVASVSASGLLGGHSARYLSLLQ